MGFSVSSSFSLQHTLPPLLKRTASSNRRVCIQNCFSVSYHKFVDFALDETSRHTHLLSSPLQVFILFFFCIICLNLLHVAN